MFKTGSPIAGATDSFVVMTQAGVYYLVVNEGACMSNSSNTINYTSIRNIANQNQFKLYPNPAQNMVTIACDSFDASQNINIAIADLAGRIVAEQKADGYQTEIDVTNLSNGTYFVTLQNGENKAVSKLVIVK
mgnify:CR=1 FL=1